MKCEANRLPAPPGEPSTHSRTDSSYSRAATGEPACRRDEACTGLLIMNADDWGREPLTTNRILDCALRGAVSSVSAMVFMADSERAATMARERGIEAGLHLNLTTSFSAPGCPGRLVERQQELARYLLRHRLAQVVFHPGLVRSFEYVVAAQLDEFRRLYGADPDRDRKSTRLNSSHGYISYAVFCLKKKKKRMNRRSRLLVLRRLWKPPRLPGRARLSRILAHCFLPLAEVVSILPLLRSTR